MSRSSAAIRWTAIGLAIGLNFGNAGPIASDLADAFGTGLGAIGLITTALLVAHAASQLPSAGPIERLGPGPVIAVALVVIAATNGLAALAPGLEWLIAARLLMGCATGPAFVASLEGSRQAGGPLMAGVFGGAATLGLAVALAAGTVLEGAGASWRATFVLSGAAALLALAAVLPLRRPEQAVHEGPRRELRAALANRALWRLSVLHASTFGSSLVVGAWIIEYLELGDGVSAAAAGAIGALLLTLTSIGRPLGGLLVTRGAPWALVAVAGSLCTAAGLAALVVSRDLVVVVPASLLVGVGFALPFAATFHAAVRAEPARAASATALVNVAGAAFALAAAPLVGLDLDRADGRLSFAALAALALVAAALNRHPPRATA